MSPVVGTGWGWDYLLSKRTRLGDLVKGKPFAFDPPDALFQSHAVRVTARVPAEGKFAGISGEVFRGDVMPGADDRPFEQREE